MPPPPPTTEDDDNTFYTYIKKYGQDRTAPHYALSASGLVCHLTPDPGTRTTSIMGALHVLRAKGLEPLIQVEKVDLLLIRATMAPQGPFSWMASLPFINFLATTVGYDPDSETPPHLPRFTDVVKGVLAANAIYTLGRNGIGIIQWLVSTVCIYVFGVDPLDLEKTKAVVALSHLSERVRSVRTPQSVEEAASIQLLQQECDKFMSFCSPHVPIGAVNLLMRALSNAEIHFQTAAQLLEQSSDRPKPVMVVLAGRSGLGKSTALSNIVAAVWALDPESKDENGVTKPFDPACQYPAWTDVNGWWDGYSGQRFVINDDGFSTTIKTQIESMANSLLTIVSNRKCFVPMGALTGKGNTCFTSPYIIVATNETNPDSTTFPLKDPSAMRNRVHVLACPLEKDDYAYQRYVVTGDFIEDFVRGVPYQRADEHILWNNLDGPKQKGCGKYVLSGPQLAAFIVYTRSRHVKIFTETSPNEERMDQVVVEGKRALARAMQNSVTTVKTVKIPVVDGAVIDSAFKKAIIDRTGDVVGNIGRLRVLLDQALRNKGNLDEFQVLFDHYQIKPDSDLRVMRFKLLEAVRSLAATDGTDKKPNDIDLSRAQLDNLVQTMTDGVNAAHAASAARSNVPDFIKHDNYKAAKEEWLAWKHALDPSVVSASGLTLPCYQRACQLIQQLGPEGARNKRDVSAVASLAANHLEYLRQRDEAIKLGVSRDEYDDYAQFVSAHIRAGETRGTGAEWVAYWRSNPGGNAEAPALTDYQAHKVEMARREEEFQEEMAVMRRDLDESAAALYKERGRFNRQVLDEQERLQRERVELDRRRMEQTQLSEKIQAQLAELKALKQASLTAEAAAGVVDEEDEEDDEEEAEEDSEDDVVLPPAAPAKVSSADTQVGKAQGAWLDAYIKHYHLKVPGIWEKIKEKKWFILGVLVLMVSGGALYTFWESVTSLWRTEPTPDPTTIPVAEVVQPGEAQSVTAAIRRRKKAVPTAAAGSAIPGVGQGGEACVPDAIRSCSRYYRPIVIGFSDGEELVRAYSMHSYTLITFAHCFYGKTVEYCYFPGTTKHYKRPDVRFYIDYTQDIALILFEPVIQPLPSMYKVLYDSNLDDLVDRDVFMVDYSNKIAQVDRCPVVDVQGFCYTIDYDERVKVKPPGAFTVTAATKPGSCGQVCFVANAGTAKLCGIHVAGSAGVLAQEIFLSKEVVDNWCVAAKMSHQEEIDPEPTEYVVNGSAEHKVVAYHAIPGVGEISIDFGAKPIYDAGLDFVGRIEKGPYLNEKSKMQRVLVYEDLTPLRKAPPVPGPPADLVKHMKPKLVAEIPHREIIRERFFDVFPKPPGGSPVLTREEAVYGVQLKEGKSMPIPQDTSPGFPYSRKFGLKKEFMREEIPQWLHNILDEVWEHYHAGARYPTLFTAQRKDEPRTFGKGHRCIWGAPVHYTIAMKQLFGHMTTVFMQRPCTTPCSMGINPHGNDWTMLANYILGGQHTARLNGIINETTTHNLVAAGDFTNWDGSVPASVLKFACELIVEWCGTHSKERWAALSEVLDSFVVLGKDCYRIHGANVSGNSLTTIINIIVNFIITNSSAGVTAEEVGREVRGVIAELRAAFYGDDNLLSTVMDFPWERFAFHIYDLFGMKVTNEDKTGVFGAKPFDQVHYLSRKFVFRNGRYYAPLDINRILEILHWTTSFEHHVLQGMFNSICIELWHHGREVYDYWTERLSAHPYTLSRQLKTWSWFHVNHVITDSVVSWFA